METSVRNLKQAEAVSLYLKNDPLKSTLVLATGFGKSKVTIDILKSIGHKYRKVYILVNSTILRDYSWKDEFIKFKFKTFYSKKVELATYQAAYKWTTDKVDLTNCLVIADEVDFAGDTDELSKFFYTYKDVKILGLTGFITDTKLEWFQENLPILMKLTANDAQQSQILNNLHFVFIKYDLSIDNNDIVVEYTKKGVKKSFTQSENSAYDYITKTVMAHMVEKSKINSAFNKGEIDNHERLKKIKSVEYKLRLATNKRKELLYSLKSSKNLAINLISHIKNTSTGKIIVFSERTTQSELIVGKNNTYNGTLKPKISAKRFEDFQNGVINVLGVCDKVNRGVNVDNLRHGILESFTGSDTKFAQKSGRIMRLDPNDVGTIYVFLPYYARKEKNGVFSIQETQQVKWARDMLRSTKISTKEVWDYRTLKT